MADRKKKRRAETRATHLQKNKESVTLKPDPGQT